MKLAVAILAAGASARMGRPKLLLPWRGTTVLGQLLTQWRSLGVSQLTVVCAADQQPLHEELTRLGLGVAERIINSRPDRGMFSSVQCAAAWPGWRPDITHWAVALGDQPLVRPETFQSLLCFAQTAEAGQVAQPSRNGRGRHPVILPEAVFAQLKGSSARDLKEFLSTCAVTRWEVDDPGLDLDLDEPGDYQRALALAEA